MAPRPRRPNSSATSRSRSGQTSSPSCAPPAPAGATVNDALLAALGLTIRRWNLDHRVTQGDVVSAMMPVNLRPAEWSSEVLSNFASYLALPLTRDSTDDLHTVTAQVRDRTRQLKELGVAGWIVDLLELGSRLPVQLKSRLQYLLPLVSGKTLETAVLSNLGRMTLPSFGDAGAVTETWFTPPCFEPLSLAIGAGSVGNTLFLTGRYLRTTLDDDAARRFAELMHATLLPTSTATSSS